RYFIYDTSPFEIYSLPYTTLFRSFCEKSFAVIFEDDAVDFRQHFFHVRDNRPDLLFIRGQNFFAINPDDLLLPRNNPGLSRKSRSEEHTSELQSRGHLVCRFLLEK